MKLTKLWMSAAVLIACGTSVLFMGCKGQSADMRPVAGTIEESLPADSAPAKVLAAIDGAARFHQHEILNDTMNNVCVWSVDEVDTASTEGFGVVVQKGAVSTTFANLKHTRQPMARYDKDADLLWFANSALEGTGVEVERLYQIRFQEDDKAFIAAVVEPYEVQNALMERLKYSIDGETVTFYDGKQSLVTATNTVTDMGGFDDEQPVWIGEQIRFDLSGEGIIVKFVPGIKFVTGLVLTYDDMPTFSVPVTLAADGSISLGSITKDAE